MPAGLRERKKVATKDALGQAALALSGERGLHAVTADAIAERAGVSTRTFHNYFSSKEEAVLFVLEKAVTGLAEGFFLRDPAEPVLDSMEAVLADLVESDDDLNRIVAVTRLMAEHPALIARHVAVVDTTADAVVAEIGRRTGTDPASDIYPRLVYHTANAVGRSAIELYMEGDSPTALSRELLTATLRDGFRQLRRGLAQPVRRELSRTP
jgi:AcrR family transcriptional regulator